MNAGDTAPDWMFLRFSWLTWLRESVRFLHESQCRISHSRSPAMQGMAQDDVARLPVCNQGVTRLYPPAGRIFRRWLMPVSVGMSIFNVYNRANVWYKEYEIIENQIIETPVYFLGFTPNINLTIKMK